MVDVKEELIDFEILKSCLKISNATTFKDYLQELYGTISKVKEGISKQAFNEVMKIPIFISERVFDAFDENSDGILSEKEFVVGLAKLYTGTYEDVLKQIFNIYDFSKSGIVTKSNIKLLLSYIPLNNEDGTRFNYQLKSQDELEKVLKDIFNGKSSITYEEYLKSIHENSSDILLILIGFLYNNMPFHIESLETFNSIKNSPQKSKRQVDKKLTFNLISSPTQTINIKRPSIASQFFNSIEYIKKCYSTPDPKRLNAVEEKKTKSGLEQKKSINIDGSPKREIHYFECYLKETLFRKVYLTIIGEDIFIFKTQSQEHLISMIPIKRNFVVEGKSVIDKIHYHTLSFHQLTQSNQTKNSNVIFYFITKELCSKCFEQIRIRSKQRNFAEVYELGRLLGEGAFGVVKLGTQIKSQKEVAIKILNKSKLDESQIQMACNEIDIMKQCCHPNIIELLEVLEDLENIYIIMEYVNGIDLFAFLDQYGAMSEKSVKLVMKQVAEAVKYLHTFGIVHRDLKLDNVIIVINGIENSSSPKLHLKEKRDSIAKSSLSPNSGLNLEDYEFRIKLGDFGISKVISNESYLNERIGTLRFTAPEILLGANYNKQIDNWSFGIMMFLLYSATFPFDDTDKEKITARIAYEDFEFKGQIWEKASDDFKNLIYGCLQKDPAKRNTILKVLRHDFFKDQ